MRNFRNCTTCVCVVLDSTTCPECKAKSESFQKFFDTATVKVKNAALWQGVEPEEIDMALKQIERSIMTATYDW
jgi:hypothetical protein